MKSIQAIIILATVILCGYFTFDTFQSLEQIENEYKSSVLDKYNVIYFGTEKELKLKQLKSDPIIKRGVFLNLATLSIGTFSFITIGKLQSRKEGSNETEGKSRIKA